MTDMTGGAEISSVLERGPEVVRLGYYDTALLEVSQYVRLKQVRSRTNPTLGELTNSIESEGLLNPIGVVRVDEPLLEEYIGFTNRVWRADETVTDHMHQRQEDGKFLLVFGGHTRCEGVEALQARDTHRRYLVASNIHDVSSIHEIVALQLADNIHSRPSPERSAMAVVESFFEGLGRKWATKEQFLAQMNVRKRQVSSGFMRDALAFADLPLEARAFVLSGEMSYGVAVRLGYAADTIREHAVLLRSQAIASRKEGVAAPELPSLELLVRREYDELIAQIQDRRLRPTRAIAYIDGRINQKQETVQAYKAAVQSEQQKVLIERPTLFDLALTPAEVLGEKHIAAADARRRKLIAALGLHTLERMVKLLELHEALSNDKEAKAVLRADIEQYIKTLGGDSLLDLYLLRTGIEKSRQNKAKADD